MPLHTRPDGSTSFTDDPAIAPATGVKLDSELNSLTSIVNALDNANIASTPKIAGVKVDLTTGGFLPLDGSADMTDTLNHAFDGIFRQMRTGSNGKIYEYRGSDGAIWGVSYNTYWTGSAWSGRDTTDICAVLKIESGGLHYYHAVSGAAASTPTWVDLLNVDTSGNLTLKTGGVIQTASCVDQNALAASAVGQGELKSTTGSVSTNSSTATNLTLPGGEYGFYPQIKSSNGSGGYGATFLNSGTAGTMAASQTIGTSYVTNITLETASGTDTLYAQQRYIQASPPYMIGDKVWGHFLFLLRDIATGTVRSAYEAEDPPWAYNGAVYLPKDDPGRLAEVPHPFADYWQKDPATDGLEVVMVDLRNHNTKKWKEDNAKVGKGILEDLGAVVTGKGKVKPHSDYLLPTIAKFTDSVKIVTP